MTAQGWYSQQRAGLTAGQTVDVSGLPGGAQGAISLDTTVMVYVPGSSPTNASVVKIATDQSKPLDFKKNPHPVAPVPRPDSIFGSAADARQTWDALQNAEHEDFPDIPLTPEEQAEWESFDRMIDDMTRSQSLPPG
jgi:hypothetical protein